MSTAKKVVFAVVAVVAFRQVAGYWPWTTIVSSVKAKGGAVGQAAGSVAQGVEAVLAKVLPFQGSSASKLPGAGTPGQTNAGAADVGTLSGQTSQGSPYQDVVSAFF